MTRITILNPTFHTHEDTSLGSPQVFEVTAHSDGFIWHLRYPGIESGDILSIERTKNRPQRPYWYARSRGNIMSAHSASWVGSMMS